MARVEPIQADAHAALAAFCSAFPGNTLDRDIWLRRFHFWWEDNPACPDSWTRGWLLREAGRIVGLLADIPTRWRILGQDQPVSTLSTWRVLPEFQGESLKLLTAAVAAGRNRVIFNTTPTADVAAILRGFRFRNLREGGLAEHVLLADPAFLAWKLRADRGLPTLLGRPIARVVHLAQRVCLGWRGWGLGELRVAVLDRAGPELDRLWRETSDRVGFASVRRREDLDWLVFRNPIHRLLLLGCRDQAGGLVGHGLFQRQPVARPPEGEHLVCLDLWSRDDAPRAALLRAAVDLATRSGIGLVRVPHLHGDLARAATRAGLLVRPARPATIYCRLPRAIDPATVSGGHLGGPLGDVIL
ncbi:MAG: hypothetical protein HQL82_00110 [Magnetococcales bacterium]|nr:hypothetical protein [Magnetococcales bacterium]